MDRSGREQADHRQVVAPGTHQLSEAFTFDLVFWNCKQRQKPHRLLRERVKQRIITAGNSEGMIRAVFRVPRGGSTGGDRLETSNQRLRGNKCMNTCFLQNKGVRKKINQDINRYEGKKFSPCC